ncbi:MAG TPA: DciA family protein [Stellaceae bacterium]
METDNENRKVAEPGTRGERRPGLRALGEAVARLSAPIAASAGGTLARLKSDWPAIVGAESAAATWPTGLSRDGALKLHAAADRALEIQHSAPMLIDRINLFLGRKAVLRIVLVQGPLPAPLSRPAAPPEVRAEEARAIENRLTGVADAELHAALMRLGRSVWASSRRNG